MPLILKWQGDRKNLRIEKKINLQLSSPIIIWLYFHCRVEWILVILPLIPFSPLVLTFVVSADGHIGSEWPRWSISRAEKAQKWEFRVLMSICRLFATLLQFFYCKIRSLLGDILLFILMGEKGFETLRNSSNHLKYGFHVSWVNKKVK